MRKKKNNLLIWALILIGVIVLGAIIYLFVIRPSMTGNVIGSQKNDKIFNEGIKYAVFSIMQQATLCRPVPLTLDNQTIEIIAIDCLPPEMFPQPPI